MPSPIAGETSVDERKPARIVSASRKKRKRKCDCANDNEANMSPEDDSTASPPAGLIAGREEEQQRLTSPPSGSKFVHDRMASRGDEFGETGVDESTIIKNRSEEETTDSEEEMDDDEDEEENIDAQDPAPAAATASSSDMRQGGAAAERVDDRWSTSDVENFDGKIVYNPDGSAYIIEDSEMSDEDADLPQLIGSGCIVDGRGVKVTRNEGFPQIANAIYVSSKNQSSLHHRYHHSSYDGLSNHAKSGCGETAKSEIPVMHSYRVYSVRDNKYERDRSVHDNERVETAASTACAPGGGKDCSSVPVKPILMCFICKLSFGYAKSFVGHAMSDHNVMLQEDEKDLLSHKNTSAIIQCVGKDKEPLVSFLEPLLPPVVGAPLDGKYRPSVGQSSFLSNFDENSTQKVPNKNNNNNNNNTSNKCKNNNNINNNINSSSSSCVKNNIADGNGSSEYDNGAESLVIHRRDRSPQFSSQNAPVPEAAVCLSRSNSNFNNNSSNNTVASINSPAMITPACNRTTTSLNGVMDLTRKSPVSISSTPSTAAVTSPGTSSSPGGSLLPTSVSPSMPFSQHPPNFHTGTTIGVCPDHMGGRPSGVDCAKCELILSSARLGGGGGPLSGMHSRNSCKTLKCPKCNWHYKYHETLEIHMKDKHPETETSCIYCIAGQPHPRLARGETYTCGYKPYRCEVCNYSTTTKGNLSIHMQSDKHLNNMQELQNGTVVNPELSPHQSAASALTQPSHSKPTGMSSPGAGSPLAPYHSSAGQTQKPKPTFRCEVCNYETNVARNLRIHMTSEKHTHNILVLRQNMNQIQALSALQQSQQQQQPNLEQLLHFHPTLSLPGDKPPPHSSEALADMAYNQALLIQLMTGGPLPSNISPELSPNVDMGLDPGTMEPPPEPADLNPENLYQCCVCNIFTSNSLEVLSQHLGADRTRIREQEILVMVVGNFVCKLCTYKTNLKANFQLHCKTDKHLQRLQHVNHVKEGGVRNEWKLKYVSSPGSVQVRCNACDYYTNSTHKLQLHSTTQRHEFAASLFFYVKEKYDDCTSKFYQCVICEFSCTEKLSLFQHIRSPKHFQIEHLHQLQRRSTGKDSQMELGEMFKVIPQNDVSAERERKNSSSSNLTDRRGTPESKDLSDLNNSFNSDHMQDGKQGKESRSSSVERENAYSCPYCTYSCSSEMRIQAHILTQHTQSDENSSHQSQAPFPSSPKESFCCPLCQDKFTDKITLEKHVMQIHSVNSEGLQRLLILVDQSHWLNNSKINSNSRITPPSQRHSPSSSTASSGSKDIEMRCAQSESSKGGDTEDGDDSADHIDTDSCRCPFCGKIFRNSDDLCVHQNESGHFESKSVDGINTFSCPKNDCNAFFTTVLNTQRHYLEVHIQRRVNTVAVSEKHVYKYRCSQCSLAFKTMEKLQIHSQYHLIRDATKCGLCGRSFRTILALQKHVEGSHADLSEEEMILLKQSLLSNPLLLASLGGQILDPSITELLKKESIRMDMDEAMDEGKDEDNVNATTGVDNSEEEEETYKEQFIEDYLNSQSVAEENYSDPNRKYKCHKCRVAFTRQTYLTQHNKKVPHRKSEKIAYSMDKYMDPNRPYKCEVCIESFTQKNILLVHYNSVSHLHKLKRASQESHNNSSANLMISPPSNHLTAPRSNSSSEEDDKKPYKCNVCNVAYPQVTTLDIHLRSVLHQTRVSRLQQDKDNAQNSQESQLTSPNGAEVTPTTTPPVTSSSQTQIGGIVSCPRCNTFFVNQEQLHMHQQFYCPFGSVMNMFPSLNATSNLSIPFTQVNEQKTPSGADDSFMKLPSQVKKPSHMYKHLLESFGFDLVMQFNENHQRRQRKEREENERLLAELHSVQMLSEEKPLALEEKKDNTADVVKEEKAAIPNPSIQDIFELSKSTCAHCNKEFSSVWVLKAHCEEVHKDLVPLDFLEKYAQQIKCEIEKKVVPGTMPVNEDDTATNVSEKDDAIVSSSNTADVGTDVYSSGREDKDSVDETSGVLCMSTGANVTTDTSVYDSERDVEDHKEDATGKVHNTHELTTTQNVRTACSTPASSTESIPPSAGGISSSNPTPNIPMTLAQQMTEMQAALNAMAASQLQQQLQQFNPMMMGMASLGMGLPVGLNMPALAAMNLQPPLVPIMMPPPSFDPIVGLGSAQNALFSQQSSNMDASSLLAKQQQHLIQQQQQQVASASQQKRARTRITDDQLKILRAHFDINNSPSEEQINKMAAESGLPPKVIKHWFRNTLFKERQRNKDSPYNFNNPPSTTLNLEEYEKTGEAKVTSLTSSTSNIEEPLPCVQPSNVVESVSKMSPPAGNKKSCTPSPKIEQMSQHFQNLSLPPNTTTSSFSVPHSVAASLVQIKSEPKDTLHSSIDHQIPHFRYNNVAPSESKYNHMLPVDVENRVKKEEIEDMKTNMYAHDRDSHLPVSPNISDCYSHNMLSCGNSNSSNSSGGSTGKRANRTRFTDYQIKVLQEFFENNAYPKDDDLEYLSKLLSLSPRVIVVWFQNARQKARKVYENQPPVEPAPGVDENSGRFQRTPGLNYQCKKCLLVFQRYYELIRHQKTHCFKEEDAKRSAQAQAAAAQIAAVLSSEDSNSSTIVDQSQQCNVTNSNPSTPVAPVTPTPSSAYPPSPVAHNPSTPESKDNTLQCENCNLVFSRFELWREHQLIHLMNPNLFPNYAPESPFGILQQQAQPQQQAQVHQNQSQQQQPHESFNSSASSEVMSNSNPTSPHPLLAMFNSSKRKHEEYVYLSDKDADQPKDKRLRTTIQPDQLEYLYKKYQTESNPSRKMLENIANEVGLTKRVVQVWFQNTRARERKGQFRAHSQVINKRCPFCPALFKVKSALESHITTKHTDQCCRGEINIDALPDEETSLDSVSFLASSQQTNIGSTPNPAILHPLLQSAMHGATLVHPNQGLETQNYSALFATSTNKTKKDESTGGGGGECPLDLSKPLADYDDNYSESEFSENMDNESEPESPESGVGKQQITPETLLMLQHLYGYSLAAGFQQNCMQSPNANEKLDEQLSLNSRFKKMECGPEEEGWSSDEEREVDNNNKMQMASPSKTYNSTSELYNQSLTPAETAAAQSLKMTYQ